MDVNGETAGGDFAPIIDKAILPRHWTSVPACPDPGAIAELFSGRCDSQWVETEGTVRAVAAEGQDAALTLVSGPCEFKAVLSGLGS